MKVFELTLDDLNLQGIFKISHVDFPAMESNYVALNKLFVLAKADEEKRMVFGVVMFPNKEIPRIDDKTQEEYKIWFSAETIELAAHEYIKSFRTSQANVQHAIDIDGVHTVESWIVVDPEKDKATALGLDVIKGAWVIGQKIENQEFWNDWVKTKRVRAFSLEGFFTPNEDAEELAILAQVRELLSNLK